YLDQVLKIGVGRPQRKKQKLSSTKFVWNNDVYRAMCAERDAYHQWKISSTQNKEVSYEELRKAKKMRKKLVKKHKHNIYQQEVKKIEEMKGSKPSQYWKRLIALN